MKAVLCVFGLILTCTLHLAARIPVQPNFRYQKVEGVWHRVAMVLRGAEAEVVGADIKIMPMPKGDLSVQRQIEIRYACRQISSRYRHTNTPGRFKIFFSYGSQSTVHFVATDYNSYLFLHIKTSSDTGLYLFVLEREAWIVTVTQGEEEKRILVNLQPDPNQFSSTDAAPRGSDVSPVIMEKFEHQSESLGFSKHSIRYTDTKERCTF